MEYLSSGVEIGLASSTYAVNESNRDITLLEVCAELNFGTLERNVSVILTSMDGSATSTGKTVKKHLCIRL